MDRRTFVRSMPGAAMLASSGVLRSARAQPARARILRFIPHADLANFDPIWSPAYIARNAGMLVWDTLYGVDSTLTPRRQMIETEQVSDDGLIWTFRLREGLNFHDGEPVRARDAVASIRRWSARDPLGQMIRSTENELVAIDDRTFRWSLKKPFRKMLLALGKVATPCCFIMPERVALTDPFKQINEYVGSGPARFVRSEWVPGAKAVFEKFEGYQPRPEPSSWIAGGKVLSVDRVEWDVISDPATAAAALQAGEVDWWERTLPDLVPPLSKNRQVALMDADPFGYLGLLIMNHLHPPFDDVRVRHALLMAISQEDYIGAAIGSGGTDWKAMTGYFAPGSPFYTEGGGEILKGPRDLDSARRLIRESGYSGEPIVCMAAQDIANHKAWGEVTADLLRRLGMKVDYVAVDWGTVVARRGQKAPPGKGVGTSITTAYSPSIRSTQPRNGSVLRAIRRSTDGRKAPASKPRWQPGSTRRPSMRRSHAPQRSTRRPWKTWFTPPWASTSPNTPTAPISLAWRAVRCRFSGTYRNGPSADEPISPSDGSSGRAARGG